jgi:hypothetical protein
MCFQEFDRRLCANCKHPYYEITHPTDECEKVKRGEACDGLQEHNNDKVAPTNGGKGGLCASCVMTMHEERLKHRRGS